MSLLKLTIVLAVIASQGYASAAGVSVSKTTGYAVYGPAVGASVSKTNAYVVYGPPTGASVSKTNAYVVYGPASGTSVSKVNVYVVVSVPQPSVHVITMKEKRSPVRDSRNLLVATAGSSR